MANFGRITNFFPAKHYGFILNQDGVEIFFHEMNLVPRAPVPIKGDRAEYDLGQFKGRTTAVNVRILPRDAQ